MRVISARTITANTVTTRRDYGPPRLRVGRRILRPVVDVNRLGQLGHAA